MYLGSMSIVGVEQKDTRLEKCIKSGIFSWVDNGIRYSMVGNQFLNWLPQVSTGHMHRVFRIPLSNKKNPIQKDGVSFYGVGDGTRTHDLQSHNLAL